MLKGQRAQASLGGGHLSRERKEVKEPALQYAGRAAEEGARACAKP